MATKKIYYVAEGPQEADSEAAFLPYTGDQPTLQEEVSEPRCTICNELLAWHEQACSPASPAPAEDEPSAPAVPAGHSYAYNLGHLVQPVRQKQPRTIIWRGQLKERHPQTGLVYRVNVYRLDDNFWDCYHEEELQLAA